MEKSGSGLQTVLITGGTSGLGLELVRLFLDKGDIVIATGRNPERVQQFKERFKLFVVDFSDLKVTDGIAREICRSYSPDLVINNAGVLSPPDVFITADDLEYSFQVNFLSHLLLNEIIIKSQTEKGKLFIASVTSQVYRNVNPDQDLLNFKASYRPFKAYSLSKFFLALMCNHFSERYDGTIRKCIGFDPGIFSSGIPRMQKSWFRIMYLIGTPFMKSSRKAAISLTRVIERNDLISGSVYDFRGRVRPLPGIDDKIRNDFWKECYKEIERFLN